MNTDAVAVVVPFLGESITEAVIGRWLKTVGEVVRLDEPVVDLETDKVNVQVPAPASGVMSEQKFAAGATVRVGEVIGDIAPQGAAARAPAPAGSARPVAVEKAARATPQPAAAAPAAAPKPQPAVPASTEEPVIGLSPSRRRALREKGAAIPAGPVAPTPVAVPPSSFVMDGPGPQPTSAPAVSTDREEVVSMSPLRKRIAARLVEAQHSAAVLTTFNEADMSSVMALRARYQDEFQAKHGVKVGLMSFFTKAAIEALREFPGLNAEIRDDSIVYKRYFDIGIAVGSGRGLVVPVIRDAERLSFAEVEIRIADFALRAKDNRLTLEELAGGTFTITNGGVYGSLMATPLLNLPQTGILGMHRILKRPVAIGDSIELRPMMYLALSYDHRVVDGRESVQFLLAVKQRIENPERLILGL